MSNSYIEKFKDPRWQKKRLEILERDEFTCQECQSEDKTLHIHHKYYDYGKDPWDYPCSCLITLCEDCHESQKVIKKANESLLLTSLYNAGFSHHEVERIACWFSELAPLSNRGDVVADAILHFFENKEQVKRMLDDFIDSETYRNIYG